MAVGFAIYFLNIAYYYLSIRCGNFEKTSNDHKVNHDPLGNVVYENTQDEHTPFGHVKARALSAPMDH